MTTIVVEGLIFCISATPHLGTSFPLFHGSRSAKYLKCLKCESVVGAFNQEKAIVGAFSIIVKSSRTFVSPSFQALLVTGDW